MPKCLICNESIGVFGDHSCPPQWYATIKEFDFTYGPIYAETAEDAAITAVSKLDDATFETEDEMPCAIRGKAIAVYVKEADEDPILLTVIGEMVPRYGATRSKVAA